MGITKLCGGAIYILKGPTGSFQPTALGIGEDLKEASETERSIFTIDLVFISSYRLMQAILLQITFLMLKVLSSSPVY